MVTEHGTRRQGSSEVCFRLEKNRTLLMFLRNTLKQRNIRPKAVTTDKDLRVHTPSEQ